MSRICLYGLVLCGLSRCQGGDLHKVVGEHAVSAPDGGAFAAVDSAAVPLVAVFEVADAPFAAGAPLDEFAEGGPAFVALPDRSGSAFSWNGNGFDAEIVEIFVDGGVAVAAVGGGLSWGAAGALGDPSDRGGKLRRIRRVALSTV